MKTIYFSHARFIVALHCFLIFLLSSCDSPANKESSEETTEKVYVAADQESKPMQNKVERGRYMVAAGGCNDCHTPKSFGPQGMVFDTSKLLSGHPAEMPLPAFDPKKTTPGNWILFSPTLTAAVGPWGASFSANLTPDSTTGLGAWKEENFLKALQTGKHMGLDEGRPILPPMPWHEIAKLETEDLKAIFAYLQSIKPVKNKVPAPVSPKDLSKIAKGGIAPTGNGK